MSRRRADPDAPMNPWMAIVVLIAIIGLGLVAVGRCSISTHGTSVRGYTRRDGTHVNGYTRH